MKHKRRLTQTNMQDQQLEILWDQLLSRQPEQVREMFNSLDQAGQKAVRAHLQRMASENGWQPEQRQSAQAALQALDDQQDQEA